MTKEQREENQRYYVECCQREGWMDEQLHYIWPEDPGARAKMGRDLFGLMMTNKLDAVFLRWLDFAKNPTEIPGVTPGLEWRPTFAAMAPEQRDFVLRVIDDVLKDVEFGLKKSLDRFAHGDLDINLTVKDEEGEPKFTVQIQPHGFVEMFQEDWEERFGRGKAIGRTIGRF